MRVRRLLATCSVLAGPARAFALEAVRDSIDDLPAELQAEYTERDGKFHLQVNGMVAQSSFDNLQRANNNEKTAHNALKARIKENFGEESFEDIHAKLDRIPELEAAAAGKVDDEAINNIVESRIKTKTAPLERELGQLRSANAEKDQTISELQSKETRRTIRDAVRDAAKGAKVTDEALDDALLLGDNIFEVSEDGKVVVKEGTQYPQGIEASALFTDLQSKKPHWFPPSQGGGAEGNRGGGGGSGSNPFTAANWNLTEQGRLMEADPAKADQLARLAGHRDAATAMPPAPAK